MLASKNNKHRKERITSLKHDVSAGSKRKRKSLCVTHFLLASKISLRVNEVLTGLFLNSNRIGDEGTKALASALRINGVLTKLVLSRRS